MQVLFNNRIFKKIQSAFLVICMLAGMLSAVTSKLSEWKSAGQNLITSLWEGFKSKVGEVTSGATTWATNIISAVKSKFGIASPSKEFAAIGRYMAEGLGVGWDNEFSEVQNDINEDLSFKASIEPASVTAAANSLNGVTFYIQESVDLGDTQLKEIISKYTIQQIGNETRAVKVAQGGFYGIS